MEACKRFCIVCANLGYGYTPAEFHHILKNGRRVSHMQGFGLCTSHHRSGVNNEFCVSRHPWRQEFERRYGPETRLLEQVRHMVKEIA